MIFRTIGVNILVEKDPKKPYSEGGILIPECLERTPRFCPTVFGTVRGIGGKVKVVKVGDRVALMDAAGDDYFWKGKKFTILREKDIWGIAYEH